MTTTTTRRRWTRDAIGRWCLILGVLLLAVLAVCPAPYVIRQPGPTFNALGGSDDRDYIAIDGAQTYDTGTGELHVMTVNIYGNPDAQPNWLQVVGAWLSPGQDVLPVEAYYPEGVTTAQRTEQTTQMMVQAEDTAIAAALHTLDYPVGEKMTVAEVTDDGAAAGILQPGDVIVTIAGQPVTNLDELGQLSLREEPTEVVVRRGEQQLTLTVTPKRTETPEGERPLLGVVLQYSFDFPVEVQIDLGDVGGPSAGMMFALATYDKLTEGELTGGDRVAGTGTITPDGEVGPIGGIRQKLYAAADIHADYFIAPASNCAEALAGGIPGDLTVYAVTNLSEALTVVETNAKDAPTEQLPQCEDTLREGVPQG